VTAKTDLKGLLPVELEGFITSLGKEKYRAKQLLRWIYAKGVNDFSLMTDLAKGFREDLENRACVSSLNEIARMESEEDEATKILLQADDGQRIETVAMDEGKRRTVCVSSQVGCSLGCAFCATASIGLKRNLLAGEIVDQVLHTVPIFDDHRHPVTNVVMMGMGEPLQNLDNICRAVRLLRLELGLAISSRKVTISTAGLVPQFARLADEGLNIKLAVSLNATTDEVRSELMPINNRYGLDELLRASNIYARTTSTRVTFEYALIDGVNDSDTDAKRLVKITHGIPCKINLIPFNSVPGGQFQRPTADRIAKFKQILHDKHMTVTIRWSRGADIGAACGQLRAQEDSKKLPTVAA